MNAFLEAVAAWLVDYFAAATVVLAAALLARMAMRQPAARMVVAWSTCLGLVLLAVLTAAPLWPRIAVTDIDLPWPATNIEPPVDVAEDPMPPALFAEVTTLPAPIEIPVAAALAPMPAKDASVSRATLPWTQLAAAAWLGTVALAIAWIALGHWRARGLLKAAVKAPAWAWEELRTIVALSSGTRQSSGGSEVRRVPLQQLPELLASRRISTAAALGAIYRKIILPESSLAESNRPAVRAALAHEWAHIRHGDLWLLALERLLLPLLALHPLFWCLRLRVRLDQELLADAAAAGDEPAEYAEALLAWARTVQPARHGLAALSMWEHPSTLSRRVAMVLDSKQRVSNRLSRLWTAAALAVATSAVVGLSVVSLRPTTAQDEPAAVEAVPPPQDGRRPADASPLPRAAQVPVTQVQLELLVASVNREKLAAAETSLEDAIAQATESRCRREAGLVVSEIKPEEVVTLIDGLKKHEAIEVISRPQVITLDGQPANMQIGGEVPLLRVEETVNGKHEQRLEYKEFGTLLMVRPKLDANEKEESVRLDIVAEQSSLVPPGEKAVEGAVPRDAPGLVSHKFTLTEDVKLGGTLLVAESPADKKQLRDGVKEQFLLIVTPQRAIRTVAAVYANPLAGEHGEAQRQATEAALQAATAAEPEEGSAAAALLKRERDARARETAELKRQVEELSKEIAKLREATGHKVVSRQFTVRHQDPYVVAEALGQILAKSQNKQHFAIEMITVGPEQSAIVIQVEEKFATDFEKAIEALDRPLDKTGPNQPYAEAIRNVLEARKRSAAQHAGEHSRSAHRAAHSQGQQGEKGPQGPQGQQAHQGQQGRQTQQPNQLHNWGELTADVAEARLDVERAEKDFARVEQLKARGAISEAQVDQIKYDLEKAKIQLQRAESRLFAPAIASTAASSADNEKVSKRTEVQLLELDLADAKLAIEEAESELARAQELRKQSPGAISEQEIRKYQFQADRAKIQMQRVMIRLEAAKEGVQAPGR